MIFWIGGPWEGLSCLVGYWSEVVHHGCPSAQAIIGFIVLRFRRSVGIGLVSTYEPDVLYGTSVKTSQHTSLCTEYTLNTMSIWSISVTYLDPNILQYIWYFYLIPAYTLYRRNAVRHNRYILLDPHLIPPCDVVLGNYASCEHSLGMYLGTIYCYI